MSKSLSAFMRSNVEQVPNAKFAASPRFKGEDGKPVEWEICCISADEYARIRSGCLRQVPVPGKKNRFTQEFDSRAFQTRVAARCTVFPDLNSAELQDDWGVAKPEDLVGAMLIGGEFEDKGIIPAVSSLMATGWKTGAVQTSGTKRFVTLP